MYLRMIGVINIRAMSCLSKITLRDIA